MQYILTGLMIFCFTWQSTFANLFSKHYAGPRKADSSDVYSMTYGTVLAIATFAVNGFRFVPSLTTVLLGLLNGIVLVVYMRCLINGSATGPFGFLMVSQLVGGIIVPMIYDCIVRGNSLSPMQAAGVVVVLACIVIMNLGGLSFHGQRPKKIYFVWCALFFLTNGLYGMLINLQQVVVGVQEKSEMVICTYAFLALLTLLLRLATRKKIAESFHMGKRAVLAAAGACTACTAATNLMVYLLSVMPSATVLYALNNGGVLLLSCVFSVLLFKEEAKWNQYLGMVLALGGIVLLSL